MVNGSQVAVAGRAFDVLLALYERRKRVVSKNELLELVWPDQAVDEANIQVQVSMLRKALGRSVIATAPGRGYQWTLHDDSAEVGHAVIAPDHAQESAPQNTYENNVPPLTQPLIGRDGAIRDVAAMLATHRWIALQGTGGIGKTRLAQVVAQRMASASATTQHPFTPFEQGVWWIDLSDLTAAHQLPEIVARGMNIAAGSGANAEINLLHALTHRRALLVIDNCERWVEAVSAFVVSWTAFRSH